MVKVCRGRNAGGDEIVKVKESSADQPTGSGIF